jgi:hypothetical protein
MRLIFLFFFLNYCQTLYSQSGTSPLLQDVFPKKIGSIRFTQTNCDFGKIYSNQLVYDTIRIKNVSISPLTISSGYKATPYLKIIVAGSPVPPGGKGIIIVSFDASKRNELGFVIERIPLITDDSNQPQKFISVSATITEYFSPEQMSDSLKPVIRINESNFQFGRIVQGRTVSHDYKIYNDGKKPLQIRKTRTDCICVKATLLKKEISPGDSAIVHMEFDTTGKKGNDERSFSVFTNDPFLSELVLRLSGEIIGR